MLMALRAQLRALLEGIPTARRPSLRRPDAPDALLATDLPLAADDAAVHAFVQLAAAHGWSLKRENGWLLLDKPVPVPQADIPAKLTGECGCCISLLARHSGDAPAEAWIRAVVKAADAGRQPFERLCRQLRGALAEALRTHAPLPGALLPYLACAHRMFYPDATTEEE